MMEESISIRLSFISLVSDTEISLMSQNIEAVHIYNELKSMNFHHLDNIDAVDVKTTMGQLREYWNFIDCRSLKVIIQKFGTHTDQELLDRYQQSLAEFSQRRIFECPEGIFGNVSLNRDESELIVKWSESRTRLCDLTLDQVCTFVSSLRKELEFDESDVRLMKCQRSDQSLEMRFGIHSSVASYSFPLPDSKEERLASLGVWQMVCNNYMFEHQQVCIILLNF